GAGIAGQAHRPRRSDNHARGPRSRARHERHVRPYAPKGDCDGLRRAGLLSRRDGVRGRRARQERGGRRGAAAVLPAAEDPVINEDSMDPKQLRYAKTHEWARLDDGVCVVGLTQFAVDQLTDIIYIELPKVGKVVRAAGAFGEIESVKSVNDLYSPVDGEVVEVNT